MNQLIHCYFENWNLYLPLLHRPSFEENVRLGLHYRERSFGGIVLLVCAIGSTWVYDPRIPVPTPVKSRGFHWFEQVAYEPWSMLARPKLHDLQICVVRPPFPCMSITCHVLIQARPKQLLAEFPYNFALSEL